MSSTHRFRTQQYIRELEKEVFRLRDTETEQLRIVRELQNQVKVLADILLENSIPLPEVVLPIMRVEEAENMDAKKTPRHPIHIDLTKLANVEPEGPCTQNPNIPSPVYHPPPQPDEEEPIQPATLDAQAAIDFILTYDWTQS
jgi:hypothetical protein